ncbi:unnamed protein product [Peronospora farinosa]|uniref:Peptidase A1 domain-containing protein n=1 Tax=Peronospora farinosa TaxID=134698 RepID=A0AAV0SSK8_9STRA|nr:unnamed protein product [Peronospora farinosa]
MKRPFIGISMLLAAILTLSTLAASMTMELHRISNDFHPEKYARRLYTQDKAPEVVPLHLGLGTHYTWVYVGSPPQRASVIVDTGSLLMAFPCSGCDGCGNHTDQPFLADNSSTLVHVTCSQETFFKCKDCQEKSNACAISQSYLEGSTWRATVVEDVVYLGGESSFQDMAMRNKYGTIFQFGCQSSETGLFVKQVADGIMGLSNSEHHIIAKLYRETKISSNLFSLCFVEDGGTMSIGQPHTVAHRGNISYVKLIPDRSDAHLYSVHMTDVRIGGKSINADEEDFTRGHFIVDSGTTDSYLPLRMRTQFMTLFKEISGRDYQTGDSCEGYTNEDLASLPPIQLVMEAYGDEKEEVVLNIPPEQYLMRTGGHFCGNIYLSENSGGVIGASLMMNRDVIFDNGNQRVGFVDADCAYKEAPKPTITLSDSNKTTSISEGKEMTKGLDTIGVLPSAAPAVGDTSAPTAGASDTIAVLPSTTPAVSDTSASTAGPAPAVQSTSDVTSPSVAETNVERIPVPVVSDPTTTTASTPLTTTDSDIAAPNAAPSAGDPTISTMPENMTTMPQSFSSADMGDSNSKEKVSGTHPLVLTIVGAVLVVGFLLVVLITVSRRRKKTSKDQLWSRVKGDEENEEEDEDEEEEFGLAHNDEKKPSMKHQRVDQEEKDDDDAHQRSSDEEDEVFDRKSMQDESKIDNHTLLDRL